MVVDRLSKFGYFIPLKVDYNAKVVAEVFINHIVKIHGFPKSIVSDRDKVFVWTFYSIGTMYFPKIYLNFVLFYCLILVLFIGFVIYCCLFKVNKLGIFMVSPFLWYLLFEVFCLIIVIKVDTFTSEF